MTSSSNYEYYKALMDILNIGVVKVVENLEATDNNIKLEIKNAKGLIK